MAIINSVATGYVFVNMLGQYAYTTLSGGFGPTQQVISWTDNINQACVFPSDTAARHKFKQLAKCQSLTAEVKREVSLTYIPKEA